MELTKEHFDSAMKGVTKEIKSIRADMVTKKELKEELKDFATKDDLIDLKVEVLSYVDHRIDVSEDKMAGMFARVVSDITKQIQTIKAKVFA